MQKLVIDSIKPFLKSGKNLVYFASGTYLNPEYKILNYENIFLVDYNFKQNSYDGEKIFCLKMDNIEAINLFKALNIKIHFFVGLNEGLYEGGGKYPINSDSFLGYCFPLFANKLFHIGCKDYYSGNKYSHLRQYFLDLPFEDKIELNSNSKDYISPSIFSNLGRNAILTKMNKKVNSKHKVDSTSLDIFVKHNSIWSARNELDAIFTRFDSLFQKTMIQKFEKNVYPIKFHSMHEPSYKTYETDEIIDLCIQNRFKKIGLVPNGMSYLDQIKLFEKRTNGYPNEIHFYHLNKDDYKELYKIRELSDI